MAELTLDTYGDLTLDTTPDSDGDLKVALPEGVGYTYIGMDMLLTLRDIFDSITRKCLCNYEAVKRICDEYDTYTLAKINPECPFHGEKKP